MKNCHILRVRTLVRLLRSPPNIIRSGFHNFVLAKIQNFTNGVASKAVSMSYKPGCIVDTFISDVYSHSTFIDVVF